MEVRLPIYTNIPLDNISDQTGEKSGQAMFTYAMPAVCRVERNPHNIADVAIRAITRRRDGANADSTPI